MIARLSLLRRAVVASACIVVNVAACSPLYELTEDPSEVRGDQIEFGDPDKVLFWTPAQQLAGFPNYDRLFETRLVPAGPRPFPLTEDPYDLSELGYVLDGVTYNVEAFLEHNKVAGLLVLKDNAVIVEEYRLGNTRETKWVSFSVAKSVVSLLLGAAIHDGYIGSVEDPVTAYLPALRGTSYEGVRIRDVLQMSSGVAWNEDYTDPTADVSLEIGLPSLERLRFLSGKPGVAEPGTRFNYNTAETHLVGSLIRSAIGNNLSTYLAAKIWQPFGMEYDANWRLVEPDGAEHGGCCISATLRDYGRIGLFALRNGVLPNGVRVLPEDWMQESTTPSITNEGYGYLWWLGEQGVYAARGIFGQAILIDPGARLVVATHSAWPNPTGIEFSAHRDSLVAAVKAAIRE